MNNININQDLSFDLDEPTIKAIEKHVDLDLSLDDKLKFFIEKLIIATYIEMQPMDTVRKDNPNYKYFGLQFDRQQAEKILDELKGKDLAAELKRRIGYMFENHELN